MEGGGRIKDVAWKNGEGPKGVGGTGRGKGITLAIAESVHSIQTTA